MAGQHGQTLTTAARDDSFEGLLQQVAHVSGPALRAESCLVPGNTLQGGRLEIVRRLGAGGMGLVYEARDAQRRASVALKILARRGGANVYRLKNEFRALADVSHSNLVRLHELFADSDHWFFTMELVDGEPFDRWIRPSDADSWRHGGASLDESRLRAALPQLCDAIAAVHDAGKLHRDLKPSNVLVTRHGRVVVLDFGLAVDREFGGIGQTLRNDSICGTPSYMAPEQAAGMPATTASDLYAFGVMLFEALTGKLPFVGAAHEMLRDKQLRDAPRVSRAPPSDSVADLASLCDALLQRDPTSRPDQAELQTALRSPPATATRPPRSRKRAACDRLLGREREMIQLREAYEATRAGASIVTFVSGESGIGKSALCHRFLDELRMQSDAVVLAGRCHERESVPFKGIDSLVDALSRFLRTLSGAEAAALMPREVYALARIFPALGRIAAVAQAPTKDIVDPQELRLRAFCAFCELLARIRDRRPLVLYIDDAQWLDRDAAMFLGYVLAQHEPVQALLLLSHRSEAVVDNALLMQLQENVRFDRRTLELGPLSAAAATELATKLLGAPDVNLARKVASESSGSPFFLEELSRRAQRPVAATHLTLQGAVLARVGELDEGARHALEVLAVSGVPMSIVLTLDVEGITHEHLDVLHAERLVRRSDSGGTFSIECYHDKIRESVIQGLPVERLQKLHASLVTALLMHHGSEVEQLALHAEGAGSRQPAAHYAEKAAMRASESMAFDQAAMFYARAIALNDNGELDRRALQEKLGDALANAGRGAEAARAYLEAARAGDVPAQDALELKRRAAEQLLISGQIGDGRKLLGEVLQAIGMRLPRDDKAPWATLIWERLQLKLRRGGLALRVRTDAPDAAERRALGVLWTVARGLQSIEVVSALALNSRYVRLALDSGMPDHAAQAVATEALFTSTSGDAAAKPRAEALGARAMVLATGTGRPDTIARVQMARGCASLMQGDYQLCVERSQAAIETLRERCVGVAFELGVAHSFSQGASNSLDCSTPAAQLAALIDEASRRGDALAAARLMLSSAMPRLLQGDAAGLRRHIEQGRRHWSTQAGYTWPHVEVLLAESCHATYLGDHQRSLDRLQSEWALVERGHFLRAPHFHMLLRTRRGCSALGVLRQRRDSLTTAVSSATSDPRVLRALVRSEARALARVRTPIAPAFSQLLYAGLAIDQRRTEQAVDLLRAALARFEAGGVLIYAAAVRRRLGLLLGGAEGAALVVDGERALRAAAATDLDAATRLLALDVA